MPALRKRGKIFLPQISILGWAPVAHACNPSYSGGRDQEGHNLKPAQANILLDLISKNLHKNRASEVAQSEGHEFKPQYH
jgi:hypothetical protein